MGNKDTVTKVYMSQNHIFADVFNFYLYQGKQVIKPEDLQEVDSVIADIPYGAEHTSQPVQKIRGILKNAIIRSNGETAYMLLGIELQSGIHYAMPVKAMVYDALNYSIQVANAAKSHRNSRRVEKHTNAEFLSGFY